VLEAEIERLREVAAGRDAFSADLSGNSADGMVLSGGMGFDPVSDRRNFVTTKDPDRLRQQAEDERLVRKSQ
jgi:hypothetical protein